MATSSEPAASGRDDNPDVHGRAPDRQWTLHNPLAVNVVEWGDAGAPPVVLVHGGGDFARSFDGFAPRLAGAGWRVVAWDHRGHGDSDRADLYGWSAELRDLVAVLRALGPRPLPVIGHSKGGVLALDVAAARPQLCAAVVAIDGFIRRVYPPQPPQDTAARWLDLQRSGRRVRAESAAQLADGRQRANPRLPRSWIEHLVEVGSRPAGEAGQRAWKIDPAAFPLPPHPVSLAASLERLGDVRCPVLALRAGVDEPIAGQPDAGELRAHLPEGARLEVLDGLGHFAHVEAADALTRRILAFLEPWRRA